MSRDPLPWKRVRRGERTDHQVLRVGEDVFADPRDGQERARVIIDADDWCSVIAITRADEVILVKQFRFGSQEMSLEVPGGVIEPGEEPASAVARELEEETGYRAGRVLPLGVFRPNPAHFTNLEHAFVALECEAVHDGAPDHGEDLAVVLVPRSEVGALVRDGRITHAIHMAALHLAGLKGYL